MVGIAEGFASSHQVKLNPLKSHLLVSGHSRYTITISVGSYSVEQTKTIKYIGGFDLLIGGNGKFVIGGRSALRKLYVATNSILAIPADCLNPLLRLQLIKAIALPCMN